MSKDNKTYSLLEENLNNDLKWRKKEISLFKDKIPKKKGDYQTVLIRAGLPLLYAHWEGFIKYSAECYLQFVSLQKLQQNELDYCFVALCCRKYINNLLETNQFELQTEMIKNLFDNPEKRSNIPYDGIINTKSNLSFEVFRDICIVIGIDYKKYDLKQKAINEQLLKSRNNIAHGKYLTMDYEEFISIDKIVTTLMTNIKDDILNAAITERYKRI